MEQRVAVHAAVEHELGRVWIFERVAQRGARRVVDAAEEMFGAERLDVEEKDVTSGSHLEECDWSDARHGDALAVDGEDVYARARAHGVVERAPR